MSKKRSPSPSRRTRLADAMAKVAKDARELDEAMAMEDDPETEAAVSYLENQFPNLAGLAKKDLDHLDLSSPRGKVYNPLAVEDLDDVPWSDSDFEGAPLTVSIIDEGKRGVTLQKDHTLEYPELCLEVWVIGPSMDTKGFAAMFARGGCKRAESIETADLVVFTGGADVEPALYHETQHRRTSFDPDRDSDDIAAYVYCLQEGIPMFGVCRGAQFLHVMNGGKLYQHVDNHYGDHSMLDVRAKKMVDCVSSVHHQMVIAQKGMEILGTTTRAQNRWRNPDKNDHGTLADIEAFFYRETCCFGVQGHPEYSGYHYFTLWTLNMLDELICNNPDLDWLGRHLRIRPELLQEQKAGLLATISQGVKS